MKTTGLAGSPVTKTLLVGLVAGTIVINSAEQRGWIDMGAAIRDKAGLGRLVGTQLCYPNTNEMLFGMILCYNLRVLERVWGSVRYGTLLAQASIASMLISPVVEVAINAVSFERDTSSCILSGPTAILFAVLAQYHATIPRLSAFRIQTLATDSDPHSSDAKTGPVITDKIVTYLLAGQLALAALPGSALAALVGWTIGRVWRLSILAQ